VDALQARPAGGSEQVAVLQSEVRSLKAREARLADEVKVRGAARQGWGRGGLQGKGRLAQLLRCGRHAADSGLARLHSNTPELATPPAPAQLPPSAARPPAHQAVQGQLRAKDKELAAAGLKLERAAATEERNRQLENSVAHLTRQLEEAAAREKGLLQVRRGWGGSGGCGAAGARGLCPSLERPVQLGRRGVQRRSHLPATRWGPGLLQAPTRSCNPPQTQRQGDGGAARLQREVRALGACTCLRPAQWRCSRLAHTQRLLHS
jgi:hypothetical protein